MASRVAHGLAVAALVGYAAASAAAETHTVKMDGTAFAPATLTVARGDRVVWVNNDPFPHTATAAGTFDSGSVGAGKSWTWRATKAGTFSYVCSFHPTMKATLTVR